MSNVIKTGSDPRVQQKRRFNHKCAHHFAIEAYGVRIGVSTILPEPLDAAAECVADVLPEFRYLTNGEPVEHNFHFTWNPSGRDTLYKNGETVVSRTSRVVLLDRIGREIRLTVAEYAVDRVFIHSAAVGWKGKAILFPAHSFRGKSSLTAELVRRGADYYSDEYAILDDEGFVHPFPKKLSIPGEIDAYRQVDHPVEAFGGTAATDRARVGMILLTEYKPNAKWSPKFLSPANGLMELIKHTLPIRRDPPFTLEVLRTVADTALIVKTKRGEVSEAADRIIEFFEKNCLDDKPCDLES